MLTEAVDPYLTAQLRRRFSFDAAIVTVGMVASVAAAISLAACMTVAQLVAAARCHLPRSH